MIHLSPRLQAVAALVPPGARVIDVGTDHAMIPVWLVQAGICRFVLATDIRPGPLENAAALVEKTDTGACVGLKLTDGLAGIEPDGWDTVILAGMGGETMVSILSAAPWVREQARLILGPQSKRAVLRRYLIGNGWRIERELLVEDAGHIYPILTAVGGQPPAYTEVELHLGLLSQIEGDPLFRTYLDRRRTQAVKAAPYDPSAAELLGEYGKIIRRLSHAARK